MSPHGPGKYDEHATQVREATRARAVAIIVWGGTKGSGFSVESTTPDIVRELPGMLRLMADEIERSGEAAV